MKKLETPSQVPLMAERSLPVSGSGPDLPDLKDASVSRRDFLQRGFFYGGIVIVSPLSLFTTGCGTSTFQAIKAAAISEMSWLDWDKEKLVSAAFSWFLNRYVTPLLPDIGDILPDVGDVRSAATALAKKLGLKKTSRPSPTRDEFHNSYAENYVITNRYYHREMHSRKMRCCVKLDHYLRCSESRQGANFGDLSTSEIKAIAEYNFDNPGILLLPASRRKHYRGQFSIGQWQLKYVRTFTYGRFQINGYGFVDKQNQRQFRLQGQVLEGKRLV